ncbi:MAG: hypothetical protein JXJ22_11730 [Bacteroidales bacterium]|nr:hypothetical protein [Bacteroidales bacterium]
MKRKGIVYSCLVTVFLFCCIIFSNAQVQVTKGSTHHYTVSPIPAVASYNYNWSVTPGGTSSIFGTDSISNDILWDGAPGMYTITVYPTRLVSGCAGNNQTLLVSVVDMDIKWNSTSSIQCPKTDNQTGDFFITADYTGVAGAWSFSYSIDGAAEQTVTIPAGNSTTVNIDGFINPSSTTQANHTIRITSITTPDNYTVNYTGSEADAAKRLYTVTIDPTPNTSSIIQL